MRRSPAALLPLLAAYLLARAVIGAAVNPPLNGPDESAHVEYVRTLAERGPGQVTGVEARQPPTYYALATIPWRLSDGQTETARLFSVRLLSGLCGVATLWLTWECARRLWPPRSRVGVLAASLTLAPGYLFLLSSVNNDPLAILLSSLTFLAALRVWLGGGRRWWTLWLLAGTLSIATKLTAVPLVLGTSAALAFRWRSWLLGRWWIRAGAALAILAGAAVYAWLLTVPPTTSALAALARFWPAAVARALPAYVTRGGVLETFRTWWYGYDYLVRWPRSVETVLAIAAGALVAGALAGLLLAIRRHTADDTAPPLPAIVWLPALAQVAFVLSRFGFGDVLQIEMGGAAQAKAFFNALAPVALLFSAGLLTAFRALRVVPRWTVAGVLVTLFTLDAASLAVTLWHHHRWLQVAA